MPLKQVKAWEDTFGLVLRHFSSSATFSGDNSPWYSNFIFFSKIDWGRDKILHALLMFAWIPSWQEVLNAVTPTTVVFGANVLDFFPLSGYLRTSPIGQISYIHIYKPICFVLFWLYRCNRRDIFVFCFGMFSWITIFMRVSFKALFFWQNLSSMTPSLKQNHFFRPLDINVCFEGNFCLKNVFVQNFTDLFKWRPVYLLIPTCVFSYCWCCSVK